jgi:excinuclease ABC subunit C
VLVARGVEEGSADFFAGPFLPARLARRTMALTHRCSASARATRSSPDSGARPCLEYDIKRCVAPCVREICSETEYAAAVTNTRLLLEGGPTSSPTRCACA